AGAFRTSTAGQNIAAAGPLGSVTGGRSRPTQSYGGAAVLSSVGGVTGVRKQTPQTLWSEPPRPTRFVSGRLIFATLPLGSRRNQRCVSIHASLLGTQARSVSAQTISLAA